MKSIRKIVCNVAATAAILGASAANASLITFEGIADGVYNSLVFGDATLTYTGGNGNFTIVSGGGSYNGTSTAISFFENPGSAPFRLDFTGGASSVSLDVGDFGSDADSVFLGLYDAFDNLLASSFGTVPAGSSAGITFGASANNIAYALFNDEEPFPGAVYWDNISWEPQSSEPPSAPVPAPATLALFGLGLAALSWSKRKKA